MLLLLIETPRDHFYNGTPIGLLLALTVPMQAAGSAGTFVMFRDKRINVPWRDKRNYGGK